MKVKQYLHTLASFFSPDVIELLITLILIAMFPLSYFESLRWPLPGPKATHGILKGLFLILSFILVVFWKRFKKTRAPTQNLLMVLMVLAFSLSAAFSLVPETAMQYLWYPFISCAIVIAFSKIKIDRSFFRIIIALSALCVFITFAFAFFSLMFRYSVDNIYYFIFLDHRANHLLNELRTYGKYVSLGPYVLLAPITYVFFFEKKTNFWRKLLSALCLIITALMAVISNNRIDVLVIGIQFLVLLFIMSRKWAVIALMLMVPVVWFGLMVTELYFGFNLEQRIFRPETERDLETVSMRFVYWQTALYNFRNFPLFGTGPNSYNDISNFPLRHYYDQGTKEYLVKSDYGIGIHNIFIERLADTGLAGFTTFVAVLLYFMRRDALALLRIKKAEDKKVYLLVAMGSWSWILYGITDNGYGAQGFVVFFFLRGLIGRI